MLVVMIEENSSINKRERLESDVFLMQGQISYDIGNAKESSIKETKLEAKPLFDVLILF
jgi:hypothetical protein